MRFFTTGARMWLTRSLKPFTFTNQHQERLPYQEASALGLYVHIPFCRSICDFCPYCKRVYEEALAKEYAEALLCEIELVAGENKGKKQASSLYFGGGSPALLIDDIGRIIEEIQEYFLIEEGIGIELHPEEVTVETLSRLHAVGVTRISIGIQSFQEEFLNLLGRKAWDFQQLFQAIKEVPFETVSMDFIFALPGQTFETVKKDIDLAFQEGANHIAIYPFIDFDFTDSKLPKMPNREKHKLLDTITDYCQAEGYVRDSIWTFAKKGTPKYSSMTRENFLGFGCSATTLLEKQFKINTFSIEEYSKRIHEKKLPTSLTIDFQGRQRMAYYLFWSAYTTRVDTAQFEDFFHKPLEKSYGFELWVARMLGYVKKEKGYYEMTKKGAFYYHYFENFYTLSYIDKMWGSMRKEAFPEKMIL